MNVITLQRRQSGWVATFEGPGADAFVDFYGSASVPTGHSSHADAVDVADAMSYRYWGWKVRVVTAETL